MAGALGSGQTSVIESNLSVGGLDPNGNTFGQVRASIGSFPVMRSSDVSSDNTVSAGTGVFGRVNASTISYGGAAMGANGVGAIFSVASLIAPFVVQPSASSFTLITGWAAVQPGDSIAVFPLPGGAVSSLSSGLVAHSHCTVAGQVELRLSNVSTLAQNQSTRTWVFVATRSGFTL